MDGALLFGKSYETALETLEFSDPRHPELRFDSIYPHIHFLPLDDFGARLLGILTLPTWQERLLDLLFEPSTRTYGRGTMEYDAQVDGGESPLPSWTGTWPGCCVSGRACGAHSGKFGSGVFSPAGRVCAQFFGDRVGGSGNSHRDGRGNFAGKHVGANKKRPLKSRRFYTKVQWKLLFLNHLQESGRVDNLRVGWKML